MNISELPHSSDDEPKPTPQELNRDLREVYSHFPSTSSVVFGSLLGSTDLSRDEAVDRFATKTIETQERRSRLESKQHLLSRARVLLSQSCLTPIGQGFAAKTLSDIHDFGTLKDIPPMPEITLLLDLDNNDNGGVFNESRCAVIESAYYLLEKRAFKLMEETIPDEIRSLIERRAFNKGSWKTASHIMREYKALETKLRRWREEIKERHSIDPDPE